MTGKRLSRAFVDWAGIRLLGALALSLAGAAVEGLGILLLVPVISVLLGSGEEAGLTGKLAGYLPDGPDALLLVLGVFAALILLRFGILHGRNILLARLEQGFVAEMRSALFGQLADAPWSAAARLAHGRIAHALSRNMDRAAQAIGALLRGASALVLLLVQAGLALWLSPVLALIVALCSGLILLALAPIRRRAARLGQRMTVEDYQLFSTTTGFLTGLKTAKAHGLERRYLEDFTRAASRFSGQVVAVQRDGSLASLALQTAAALMAIGAVVIGYQWFDVPAEHLIVLLVLMVRLSAPLQSLQATALAVRHGEAAWRDAQALTRDLPKSAPDEGSAWATAPGFELDRVSLAPDPDLPAVLDRLNAHIPPGRITAVTGASGSGKTTLCDLIAGLSAPDTGSVLIDGKPFDASARSAIARSLAYVGQTSVPLAETLRDSLTWGTETKDDTAIWQALAVVGAEEIVRALPYGLDTELRLDGSHFSGGERQRFALARALLRRPRLMILDEATNALDVAAEEQVLRAIFAARDGATVIMVSHRPATAALADHVIALGSDA